MVKWILRLIGLSVALVLAYAATKPDEFRVVRSTTIQAPPEKIYPHLQDFAAWRAWSPYETKDPNMKRTLSTPSAGPGAKYAWDGDQNVGAGSMEILEATAPSQVKLRLDFSRPFEGHNRVEFRVEPAASGTNVTWDMVGPAPYFTKVMTIFFDMDRMIGSDFEVGLANLKALAER